MNEAEACFVQLHSFACSAMADDADRDSAEQEEARTTMRVLDNLARARAGRGGAQGEPSSEPPTRSSQPAGSSRLHETATKILAVKVVEKGAEVARKRRKGELLLSDLDPDFNGDGHVSKEEALSMVQNMGLNVSRGYIDGVWGVYDANGDGVLDMQEFSRFLTVLDRKSSNVAMSPSNSARTGPRRPTTPERQRQAGATPPSGAQMSDYV